MRTMKFGLFLFAACIGAIPALTFARPNDGDTLDKIGVGTQLHLREDIDFPASVTALRFDSPTVSTCRIVARDASPFDRALKKGETLTVTGTAFLGGMNETRTIFVFVDRKSIHHIACNRFGTEYQSAGALYDFPTIEQFRAAFESKFELRLAKPRSM